MLAVRDLSPKAAVATAILCAVAQFALTILILKIGMAWLPPQAFGKVKLAAFASTILLPLLLVQLLGLWGQVGLRPGPARLNPVFLAALVLTTTPFLVLGLHVPTESGGLAGNLLIQLLNAFGEELLFRGVIFALLIGLPQWQAIALNGLLFGSMHLIHGVMDGDWRVAAWKAAVTTVAGMMFTAVRFASASLWPVVALHMLMNLAMLFSNVPAAGHTWQLAAERFANLVEIGVVAWVLLRASAAHRPAPAAA